jgi:uncharacterized protein YuzE
MTPLTVNPTVVVLIDENGNVIAMATNVASDLTVIATDNRNKFDDEAKNKPFVEILP